MRTVLRRDHLVVNTAKCSSRALTVARNTARAADRHAMPHTARRPPETRPDTSHRARLHTNTHTRACARAHPVRYTGRERSAPRGAQHMHDGVVAGVHLELRHEGPAARGEERERLGRERGWYGTTGRPVLCWREQAGAEGTGWYGEWCVYSSGACTTIQYGAGRRFGARARSRMCCYWTAPSATTGALGCFVFRPPVEAADV